MAQAKTTQKKSSLRWIIVLLVILALVAGGVVVVPRVQKLLADRSNAATAPKTATVTTITAVTSVTSAGTVSAVQSGSLFWKTTGTVAQVLVQAGDQVKAGAPLMILDSLSVPQNVIQAQADLISARRALDDLLHPTDLSVANASVAVANAQDKLDQLLKPKDTTLTNAEQAVARAQDTLDKAQKTLAEVKSPDVKYYQDQLRIAQDAVTNAQQNVTLNDISQLQVSLRLAQKQLETATNVYNNAKDAFAQCPACLKVFAYDRMTTWEDAVNLYNDAVNQVQQLQTQIDQSQRGGAQGVSTAQDNLDKATRNLAWALQGPEATTLAVDEAAVKVAEATLADAKKNLNDLLNPDPKDVAAAKAALADAQDKLNHLVNGADPRDVATAQARLDGAQATVQGLTLTAPFDGEVVVVNFQPGDAVALTQAAVVLADRSALRVDAQVDEADIGQVAVGNSVSVTLEALPKLAVDGKVTWINGNGASVQGLVKYTVRIELAKNDPRILLGMTADVSIVTDTQLGALAVPLDAVQLDQQGEYVNRVRNGAAERVNVTSGQIQGDLVVVAGPLQAGDSVQIIPPKAAGGSPFGGGAARSGP